MKNIVIVESPSKSTTIEKYLGKDFEVVSSKGHIRDLATSGKDGLGVDFENQFEAKYKISKEKKDELLKPLEIPQDIKNWIEEGLKLDSLKQLRQQLYLYEYLVK